jgi:hypothetical protein
MERTVSIPFKQKVILQREEDNTVLLAFAASCSELLEQLGGEEFQARRAHLIDEARYDDTVNVVRESEAYRVSFHSRTVHDLAG